jgi:hypothetical protein
LFSLDELLPDETLSAYHKAKRQGCGEPSMSRHRYSRVKLAVSTSVESVKLTHLHGSPFWTSLKLQEWPCVDIARYLQGLARKLLRRHGLWRAFCTKARRVRNLADVPDMMAGTAAQRQVEKKGIRRKY